MQVSALSVRDVSAGYGGQSAIESIGFDVDGGDILGIVGPNGAGKTTLFRAILDLHPHTGTVSICGRCCEARRALLPLVGYVPQRVSVERGFPATVRDIVSMGALPQRRLEACARLAGESGYEWQREYSRMGALDEKVDAALDAVAMSDLAGRRIGELSTGEAQRALIAKSLVNDPLLLILDEPASSVDAGSRERLHAVMRRLNSELGTTIVWSSHDRDALERVATSVACMDRRLVFHGDKDEFFSDEEAVRSYTEASMQAHMHMERIAVD